jgi:hypothetical protein
MNPQIKAARGMPTIASRTAAVQANRRSGRHDENPTESGCIFAAATLVAVGAIIILGMVA